MHIGVANLKIIKILLVIRTEPRSRKKQDIGVFANTSFTAQAVFVDASKKDKLYR